MKVLYITTHFDALDSSAAVRNAALVGGLVENGHVVDVLTVKYAANKSSIMLSNTPCHGIYRTELGMAKTIYKTEKLQKKINNSFLRNVKKIIKEILFFPDVFMRWPSFIDTKGFVDYDVFISSSDCKTSHLVGLKLKKEYPQIRWIQIWGDPWSFDSTVTFITHWRAKYKEAFLLSKADKIVYVSKLTYQAILQKYPSISKKLNYIPRSYLKEIYRQKRKDSDFVYHIIYAGSLNSGRDFDAFLTQVDEYNKINLKKFQVSFYGNYLKDDYEKLSKYHCVEIFHSVDYSEIMNIYQKSDALLFISNNKESTQIPGKLFDYMGTELPVICVLSGNIALINFLGKYKKCLLFKENFNMLARRIMEEKFGIEREFSPLHIAKEVLK